MLAKHALSQLSYAPVPEDECSTQRQRFYKMRCRDVSAATSMDSRANMVGLGRLELPTSRLSSARSNQLSYKPQRRGARPARRRICNVHRCGAAPGACSSAKKEKRRRRCPALVLQARSKAEARLSHCPSKSANAASEIAKLTCSSLERR